VSYDPEPEINRYLDHLSRAAHDLPRTGRQELLSEIEQHIRHAVRQTPCANRDEMLSLLEQVGDPAEIAAAADDQTDTSLERLPGPIASLRTSPRKLIITLAALTMVGLAIGAAVWTQSYQPLALNLEDPLTAYGESAHGEVAGYKNGHPFLGFTIQNTGPFTVRVLGSATHNPALPVLRAWSTRLMMARARWVHQPLLNPSQDICIDPNGRVLVWNQAKIRAFRPVDLAPGHTLILLWLGHRHKPGVKGSLEGASPPVSLPVKYSFLWKTATAQIPVPGSEPNPAPRTAC